MLTPNGAKANKVVAFSLSILECINSSTLEIVTAL